MVDIINIDKKIRDYFINRNKEVHKLIENHDSLKQYVQNNPDKKESYLKICSKLESDIDDIKENKQLNYYLMDTVQIIEDFTKILKKPIKVSFTKVKKVSSTEKKDELIKRYLKIIEKYVTADDFINSKLNNSQDKNNDKNLIVCSNCSNNQDFEQFEKDIYVCMVCFSEEVIPTHLSSYKDSERINISSKYTYDRKIHFRDAINQYQAKENSTIDNKVFEDLEKEFEKHFLLVGEKDTPKEIRYSRISKQTIMLFLKDLKYTKHYENINLIYYRITGQKPDDISHLEEKLLEDFDNLTKLYDETFKHLKRKNFINTKNILYQLLKRHKHPCKETDFSFLKTVDRKIFHDDISKVLFTKLGWNWVSPNF